MHALELNAVSVRYDARTALEEVNVSIGSGEHVALLGLNGSGKSTLLATAAGLVPFNGTISVDGIPLNRGNVTRVRRAIGFLFTVPEDQLLFPNVLDDVAFTLTQRGFPGAPARERALAILAELGVADLADRSPYELSHGQRMRVALAGALISEPPLLLLDEPSAGLDPVARRQLVGILRHVTSAIVLATHDVELARAVCSRYLLLDSGRIIGEGSDFDEPLRTWSAI